MKSRIYERKQESEILNDQSMELNTSLYLPSKPKTIDKIEINQFIYKQDCVQFRILTRYNNSSTDTNRRYSEFQRLHLYYKFMFNSTDKLKILPKLPDKHSLQNHIEYDQYSKRQFWIERQQDLEIYLNMLIAFDEIRKDKIMVEFLGSETNLLELNRAIVQNKIEIPLSKPEKVISLVKNTITNIYQYWQNWNSTNNKIPLVLSKKIEKIQKMSSILQQLLQNQRIRLRSIEQENKDLNTLMNRPQDYQPSLYRKVKNLFVAEEAANKKITLRCSKFSCLGKLQQMLDGDLKRKLAAQQKIHKIKQDIKIGIAKCSAIIVHFYEITTVKSQLDEQFLLRFHDVIDLQKLVEQNKQLLKQYNAYYVRTICKNQTDFDVFQQSL